MPEMSHRERPAGGTEKRAEARRRRREAVFIAVIAVMVLIFATAEVRLPRLGHSASPAGHVTFFLLINFNVLLLVLLIFLVGRNLGKLILERRRGILGSQLRMRMVVSFLSVTVVPAALLFLVAQGFLTAVIENWFADRVERSMYAARHIAEGYYQNEGNRAVHSARVVARVIKEEDLLASVSSERLNAFIDRIREELSVGGVEVVVGQESVAQSWSRERPARLPPAVDLGRSLLRGQPFARTERIGKRHVIRGGVPIRGPEGEVRGAVVVTLFVPRSLSGDALRAVRSQAAYLRLKVIKQPIRNGYTLTFLLITLVVIFLSTWVGFHFAKRITDPIQKLGEGMREVAQGNWDYRAEAEGDEEMVTLIDAFNRMTGDLKEIHSALEERHVYIQKVLENITAGVVSIESGGAVATVNPAAGAMLGIRPHEGLGRRWTDVFDAAALRPVGDMIARAAAGAREKIEEQVKIRTKDRTLTVWVTATTLAGDGDGPPGVVLFLEDVTHLLRVERMEAWREVARRIAHEIKNPLTPIQLSAQRVRKRYAALLGREEYAVLDECTRTIVRQVDELKRLVNEFSRFARLPALEPVPHDLNAIVEEALVLFREGREDVDFVMRAAPDLPAVEVDREAIKRVVINLLDNAVAAVERDDDGVRGVIEVCTEMDEGAGLVRLEVADNGCGMSAEVQARAFEPYFSTKRDGTGLGLAIVSAVIADHRAYVRVRDNVPRGTRVVIEFPPARSRPRRESPRVVGGSV